MKTGERCLCGVIVCFFLVTLSVRAQDAVDYYRRGLALADAGELEEAIHEFQTAVQNEDVDENVYLALGIFSEKIGKDLQALEALLHAREINAKLDAVPFALALLYEKLKMPRKAVDEWKNFISVTKDKELKKLARKHIRFLLKKP